MLASQPEPEPNLDPRRKSVITELHNLRGPLAIHNGKRVVRPLLNSGRWIVSVPAVGKDSPPAQIVCDNKHLSTKHPLGYSGKTADFSDLVSSRLSPSQTTLGNRSSARSAFLSTSAQIRSAVKAMMRNQTEQLYEHTVGISKGITNIGADSKKTKSTSLRAFTANLFKTFDANGDDTVDKAEFLNGLLKLSPPIQLSKEELDLVFPLFDQNNDGSLNYKEFASIISKDDGKSNKYIMSKSTDFNSFVEITTINQRKQRIQSKTASLKAIESRRSKKLSFPR
jgi:Ca2+-binding EF-hand superfamily protein